MNNMDIQDEPGHCLEKRRHHRMPCSAPIEYIFQNHTFRNLSRDISVGGVFIETWAPFSIGDELMLSIPLSNEEEQVKAQGRVVRTNRQGMGVEFI